MYFLLKKHQVLSDPNFMPAVTVPGFDVDTLKKNPVKFSPYSAYQVVNYLTGWPQSFIYWSFIFHHPDSRKKAQLWTTWQGDFDSLLLAFEGQSVAQWSSCCKPWAEIRSNTVKYETKEQQYVLCIDINFLLRPTHLESLLLYQLYLRRYFSSNSEKDSMMTRCAFFLRACVWNSLVPMKYESSCSTAFVAPCSLPESSVHVSCSAQFWTSLQCTDLLCSAQSYNAW